MQGLMMDGPLLISGVMRHAAEAFGAREVVESGPDGARRTLRYDALPGRAARLANALARLGVRLGDRVGTLAWNDLRHLEAYYAVSSMGAVCLTMNPRYAPEQLAYILDHAAPKVVLVDAAFVPLVAALLPKLASPPTVVVTTDAAAQPETPFPALDYEELVSAESEDFAWPLDLDEREAAGLCYTSGTTGAPKGVLYSHRSTVLHAMMAVMPGACALSERETVMPVVPMFHVMAWGIPYAALIGGARMVLPGPRLDGASLWRLMEAEGVTMAAGVPTIWLGLLEEMRARGRAPERFRRTMVGGSAPSPALIRAYEEEFGVEFLHGWGMTEMSPVGTLGSMPPEMDGLATEARIAVKAKQGRPVFGVSLAILDEDERELPWDGESRGRLCARGPWIASAYYRSDVSPLTSTGWLDTGDVATIDPKGFVTIVDRAKDLVKSGGEWISSIDVENAASTCPGVAMAAVIAVPHPKWDERPVIVVQPTAEDPADRERVLAHLAAKLPKWMVPDDVIMAEALPLGATGKVQKAKLREAHRDHLSGAA